MPKPGRHEIDQWFAQLGREMHAVYTEHQLTPKELRARLARIEKRMAAYRIRASISSRPSMM